MKIVVRVSHALSTGTLPMIRVESQGDRVRLLVPLSAPLQARMAGRKKAYFWFEDKEHEVEIGEEAPGQDW